MINWLAYTILAILIGGIVKAFALPMSQQFVIRWVQFYTTFMPEQRYARRAEILSDIHEQVGHCQKEGYKPGEIALKIMFRWLTGLPYDIMDCTPYIAQWIAEKMSSWSDSLKQFKTPKLVIPSFATIGLMNWSYASSQNGHSVWTWVGINLLIIAVVALMSQQHRSWARRIIYSCLSLGLVTMTIAIIWLVIHYYLYMIPMFCVYMLAMVALAPIIIVVDNSWRKHLPQSKWWFFMFCWVLVFATSLIGSQLIVGSMTPLLFAWLEIIVLALSLFTFLVTVTFVAAAAWKTGVKGSMLGLKFIAAGIRYLQ